jgi:hypothetical protein
MFWIVCMSRKRTAAREYRGSAGFDSSPDPSRISRPIRRRRSAAKNQHWIAAYLLRGNRPALGIDEEDNPGSLKIKSARGHFFLNFGFFGFAFCRALFGGFP